MKHHPNMKCQHAMETYFGTNIIHRAHSTAKLRLVAKNSNSDMSTDLFSEFSDICIRKTADLAQNTVWKLTIILNKRLIHIRGSKQNGYRQTKRRRLSFYSPRNECSTLFDFGMCFVEVEKQVK